MIDSLDMFGVTASLPDQFDAARVAGAGVEGLPSPDAVDHIVVLGMGGSAIAGDIISLAMADSGNKPVFTNRGYSVPAWVNERTLVLAVSYSGNTEETVTAVKACKAQGATVLTMSSGGEIADWANGSATGHVTLEPGHQPRSQVAALSVPWLVALGNAGYLDGADAMLDDAADRLGVIVPRLAAREADARRPSIDMAKRIDRRIPLVYGSEGGSALAAYRWKCQINENAKAPCFENAYPELDHNEICGWGQHGDMTRQVIVLVELQAATENPRNTLRMNLTREIIDECVGDVLSVRSEAKTQLGTFFELGAFGDFLSLEMAASARIDPGPVAAIGELKSALAQA